VKSPVPGFLEAIILLFASPVTIATAATDERKTLLEPGPPGAQKRRGPICDQRRRNDSAAPLDRVATAVDEAESSHGRDNRYLASRSLHAPTTDPGQPSSGNLEGRMEGSKCTTSTRFISPLRRVSSSSQRAISGLMSVPTRRPRDRGCLLRNEGFACGDMTATVCRLPERAQKSRLRKGDLLWIPYTILEHPVHRSAQRGVPPVDGIRRYQRQARE